jgi:hypothetical protein
MRAMNFAILFAVAVTTGAMTQELMAQEVMAQDESHAKSQHELFSLPQLTVGGDRMHRCDGIKAGSKEAFACLNQQLQEQVNSVSPAVPTVPVDAQSTDLKVGTVNISAVKQQYGQNFGVSVVPYRPSLSFAAPPMAGRH